MSQITSAFSPLGLLLLTLQSMDVRAATLCLAGVHAWVQHDHKCPKRTVVKFTASEDGPAFMMLEQWGEQFNITLPKGIEKGSTQWVQLVKHNDKKLYDQIGCGVGGEYQGDNGQYVSEARAAAFFPPGNVGPEERGLPCLIGNEIPIPDTCSRGIVADIDELYTKQHVNYFLTNEIKLIPDRMSKTCEKTKTDYVAKLKESGSRNCWGLTLDYKAMYCAYYGGIEMYQSANKTTACDSLESSESQAECCRASRIRAREELKSFLTGAEFGKPRHGLIERFLPTSWQNRPPKQSFLARKAPMTLLK